MKVAWWRNANLERWTYDQDVVDSTPGPVAIKWLLPEWTARLTISVYSQPPMATQPAIPSG